MSVKTKGFTTPGHERIGQGPVAGILLDDVCRTFGDKQAVSHVTLEINKGEFFSLLGPSGCGKTTTLRMLSGLEFPTSGSITLDNEEITDVPANKRSVHTVFQNYALFPHMTVFENIAYGLKNRGLSKQEITNSVEEMLDLVELRGQEKVSPGSLSGGMQQRVALARALVLKPKALLLDEPLGALDLRLRQHMQMVLRQIHQEVGITFVYVTHDQGEAFAMSDRIGVMRGGHLLQVSTPEELYRNPVNKFVAQFLGSSSRLKGTVTKRITDTSYEVDFPEAGLHCQCAGVAGLDAGASIVGVIRPECVETHSAGKHDSEPDTLGIDLAVDNVTFMGAHYRTILSGKNDVSMLAHIPSNGMRVRKGDTLHAQWRIRDMWVTPAE
ncbi:ABC transporter ATP-binding protein [Bifidobacterium biavatii]|uniref:ABC-type quaternary amine transporter n=1 Tax=Bifidobacterium biavatii DSM 23969 TaxID=1437608 RepID=A0A087A1T0_9BIFI|nr:ABC transporter ATP-binding protein [Bifidobacterium biavatii]KFI52730.1 spermidine/putrescine ABC superfamily ATP binding cassette transporter, ABC protein [Bifidobacterium biavatii DSM 23969]